MMIAGAMTLSRRMAGLPQWWLRGLIDKKYLICA
jgi:hypothetical protein